jgi:hypothetical protein
MKRLDAAGAKRERQERKPPGITASLGKPSGIASLGIASLG